MAFERVAIRPANSRDFIVQFLKELGRPATTSEIREALRQNSFTIKDASLNWALAILNRDGRIRRTGHGIYASNQGLSAKDIDSPKSLREWLTAKPALYGQMIAARIGLRVQPLALSVFNLPGVSSSEGWRIIETFFRASLVAWVTCAEGRSGNSGSSRAAAIAASKYAGEFADSSMDSIAAAIAASAMLGNNTDDVISCASHASYVGEAFDGGSDIWASIADDAGWLEGNGPSRLMYMPLWLRDVRGSNKFKVNLPLWAREEWDEFKKNPLTKDFGFDWWIRWYETRLADNSEGTFGQRRDAKPPPVDVRVTAQPEAFWAQDVPKINAEIQSWHLTSSAGSQDLASVDWATQIAQLQQAPLGARFMQHGDSLIIDAAGDESDIKAADESLTRQLHEGVRRRAIEFSGIAKRVDNQVGWTGLGEAAARFSKSVDRPTSEIPGNIGNVYDAIISLGSFLDLDAKLRAAPSGSNADPLDFEVQRAFSDLIRSAAPWVRRFPTARLLDDEAGAFLMRQDLYEPAAGVIRVAEETQVISGHDARLLQSIVEAARRGDYQGQKAGARGIFSSKNLVAAMALVMSLEVGMIGNEAASKSVIAQKGAQFYLKAESHVMKLFEDAPNDIKQALRAMMNEINLTPANLPQRPRQRFVDRLGRTRDADEPPPE
jgi:hypothetical protein